MRRLTLLLRAAAIVAVVLALLGNLLPAGRHRAVRYAMVLDDSSSMRERHPGAVEAALEAWARLDGGAHPVVLARQHPVPAGSEPPAAEPLTDIGSALREAAALFPPADAKRILLVTDGFWFSDAVRGVTGELRGLNATVYAQRPAGRQRREGILDLSAPPRVFLWEPFTVRGRVGATAPGEVPVVLRRNGTAILERSVAVGGSGIADLEYLTAAEQVGPVTFSLEVRDRPATAVSVEFPVASSPRVLFITDDPQASGPLIELYRDAGIDVRTVPASELAPDSGELAGRDIVILDDVPAGALPAALAENLRDLVGGGGRGLLAIGGRKGLGSEEYRDTLLESLLPATVGYSSPPPPARASVVIVLDTSFSMAFRGRGLRVIHTDKPRKIDVAVESAKQVVRVFRPGDRLGILGNSTDLFWIHPLGEIADPEGTQRALDGVVPRGDGLNFYSAVREAYGALREDPAPVRHIVVFCDAEDIDQYEVRGEGHAHDLIRRMAQDGVTLSVLSLGQLGDKDVPFLRTATLLGKGDFYLVSALAALPRYFVSEYRKLSSRYYLEEELEAVAGDYSPLLAGIEEALPSLSGVDTLTPRPGSRTPVVTLAGVPLVVSGRYGRGRTAVFASDNGMRWAPRWLSWGSSRRFWLKLLFSVAPEEDAGRAFSQSLDGGRETGRLVLQHRGMDGTLPPWDELWLRLDLAPAGEPRQRLERVGLRSYRSAEPWLAPGLYRAGIMAARDGGGEIERIVLTGPPAPELLALPGDWGPVESLLEGTGGAWVEDPGQMPREGSGRGTEGHRAPLALIALAVLLLCVETIVNDRRWR